MKIREILDWPKLTTTLNDLHKVVTQLSELAVGIEEPVSQEKWNKTINSTSQSLQELQHIFAQGQVIDCLFCGKIMTIRGAVDCGIQLFRIPEPWPRGIEPGNHMHNRHLCADCTVSKFRKVADR